MTYSPELFKEIDTSEDRQLSEEVREKTHWQPSRTEREQTLHPCISYWRIHLKHMTHDTPTSDTSYTRYTTV